MRRTLTALLAAGLLLLPAAPGWAQDPDPDPEPTTEPSEVLAEWAAQVSELAELLLGAHDADLPLSDEDRAAWQELFDQLLEGLEVEFMVAQAMAELEEETDDEAPEAEDVEDVEDADDDADDEAHGEIVRTVAQCAPRGRDGKDFLSGAKNHGAWVSAVARGDEISLSVPTIVREGDEVSLGESTDVVLTVATVEDAEALCDALAAIAEAKTLQAELEAAGDDAETLSTDDERPGKSEGKAKERAAKQAKPERAATGRPDHAGPKGQGGGDDEAAAADNDDTADDDTDDDTDDEVTVEDDLADDS